MADLMAVVSELWHVPRIPSPAELADLSVQLGLEKQTQGWSKAGKRGDRHPSPKGGQTPAIKDKRASVEILGERRTREP